MFGCGILRPIHCGIRLRVLDDRGCGDSSGVDCGRKFFATAGFDKICLSAGGEFAGFCDPVTTGFDKIDLAFCGAFMSQDTAGLRCPDNRVSEEKRFAERHC